MNRPESTYRLQLNKDFTLYDAARIAPYLHRLGVTHLYLSPIFEAMPGSLHGYDVTDPLRISTERGGREGLDHLDRILSRLDPPLKMILDIVPNHMAASCHNPYWYDILQNGPESEHWQLFDLRVGEGQKLQIPVLDETLATLVEKGHLTLEEENGERCIKLFDTYYPLCADSTEPENLEALLKCQKYELVLWSAIFEHSSYRRFFDITGLVGVKVEDPGIFQKTHDFIFKLKNELSSLDGVRVDHIDGLTRPAAYLYTLHDVFKRIWIEKILAPDEDIPPFWPVSGTTGYEFIDLLNRLFTNPEGFKSIHTLWQSVTKPDWQNFEDCLHHAKETVLEKLFPAELKRLSLPFENRTLAHDFWYGMTVSLPVYRTYFDGEKWSANDLDFIGKAKLIAQERYKNRFEDAEDYMDSTLSLAIAEHRQALLDWQQLSGPAMAKGLEDTAHYRYTPLLSFNEVGCTPDRDFCSPDDFLRWIERRSERFPDSFNATSTHDSKRSEDSRHRLWALSNIPLEWYEVLKKLISINTEEGISAQAHYFIYQTLISAWPVDGVIDEDFEQRMVGYFNKAINESKIRTSWVSPDKDYQDHIRNFIIKTLHNPKIAKEIAAIMHRVAPMGAVLSCAVLALKTLNCGIPDFYQGSESWCFDLVDPDNRRPIDYARREAALVALENWKSNPVQDLCRNWQDGRVKIWLTQRLLSLRQNLDLSIPPQLVDIEGPMRENILSYKIKAREKNTHYLVTIPLRFIPEQSFSVPTHGEWAQTALRFQENFHFYDCIMEKEIGTESTLPLSLLFQDFPVSVLRSSPRNRAL